VFDDKDKLVKQFGSEGSGNGQFNCPGGITFDSNNHLYVADEKNHRVQKFDVNGTYLLQFGSHGTDGGQLYYPCNVAAHNGRVYVAEFSGHRISVFQYNGQFCISFGSDQLKAPWDLAVDTTNQLQVTDINNKCIVTFTLDGHYVGNFDTQRAKLNRPLGIAIDTNGYILITDSDNHVSIFDQSGIFIHCFGSTGSSKGQFSEPCCVALSPNGSIYVSDYHNKRIQIFTDY